MSSQFNLLKTKRFLPLFLVQFCGAFNDNVFKNSFVILLTYVLGERAGIDIKVLVTVTSGVFILPFFLFSATAGQIADKYEKSKLIRYIKLAEIIFMILAVVGFYIESIYFLMSVLFMMGTQSTFFGPLKYSILPIHLKENELVSGNALVEAGTFLAILLGTIVGGLLVLSEGGIEIISAIIISVAVIGWLISFKIPKTDIADKELRINFNILSETKVIIDFARAKSDVFLSIIGISWFWFIGATFLAQFPIYSKAVFGADEEVVTLFLTVFSIGIALGSMICNKLLKGEVKGDFVPAGALGMAVFIVILYTLSQYVAPPNPEVIIGLSEFFDSIVNILILLSLLGISVFGGIYIVPLYAIMQGRSEVSKRARIIAANNVLNALFMALSAILAAILYKIGLEVNELFLSLAIINLPIVFLVKKLVKDEQDKKNINP